jgi:hypothetical protein
MGQISPVGCPHGDCITCVDHGIMVKTNEMNTVHGSMVNLITNIGELMDFQRWHKIHIELKKEEHSTNIRDHY